MKQVLEWLSKLESSSAKLYNNLAGMTENEKLSAFLTDLSKDETEHHRFMRNGLSLLASHKIEFESDILIDEETKNGIESLLVFPDGASSITDDEICDRIITIEFSEWNDFFLYAAESLKKVFVEFQNAASKIQEHLDRIKNFFSSFKAGEKYADRIESLERIWETRFLIVDDNESIAVFLRLFCGKMGTVDVAYDGAQALEKTKANFYDLIISDVDMPVCGGIDFYKEYNGKDPELKNHFIFMSGDTPDDFIIENDIPFIKKPFSVSDIAGKIAEILPEKRNPYIKK
jgi:two-component system, chemotaxis family, chemotaxis protein CheY